MRGETCDKCGGTGLVNDSRYCEELCPCCDGLGEMPVEQDEEENE